MGKILLFISFAIATLYGNSSLFYKVHKGSKDLGYYEINYKDSKNMITTKTYGVANKVKFCLDKKVKYINDGIKEVSFRKNKVIDSFTVQTKLDKVDKKTYKKYRRKLKKVKHNDMLLLLRDGKNSIELFNKRKITILTLEEILKLAIDGKIKQEKIIFFEKSGVMKMIAEIKPTQDGFDIVNRSKDKKYIKVVIKNNIPVEISSYLSDWSLEIYGAGKFEVKKVSKDMIETNIANIIKAKFSSNNKVQFDKIVNTKAKKKKYVVAYKVQIPYNGASDKKRYCNKTARKYSSKVSKVQYNDNSCEAVLKTNVLIKDVIDPIKANLIEQYPQLKFTKKIKVSKKGLIMYKIIKKI